MSMRLKGVVLAGDGSKYGCGSQEIRVLHNFLQY